MLKNLLNRFQRTTYSTDLIREIDGLRFYAIITVVLFHLNSAYSKSMNLPLLGVNEMGGSTDFTELGWWVIRLDLGVKFFFAISGFVLAIPFIKQYFLGGKVIHIKDYFLRRLTRLEPPFIISLILFFFVQIIVLHKSFAELFPHFVAGIFYANVLIFGSNSPINPVTWSLETEAQFYILVPLVFYFLGRINKSFYRFSVLIILFLISVFLKNYFIINEIGFLEGSIGAYFTNFIIGILFAWLYLTQKDKFVEKSFIWDIIGFIAFFFQFYFYKPQADPINNICFNLSVFATFLAVFKGSMLNWFFTRQIIYVIGGMCYTIYLLHYPLFHLTVKITSKLNLPFNYVSNLLIQFALNAAILLIISSAFFLLIEKPCMNKNWPNQLVAYFRKQFN